MRLFSTASILALVCMTGPVLALDLGGGFSLTGNLEYERIEVSSDSESIGLVDADISYEHSSGFGGFVGIDGISFSGSSSDTFYGALSYSGSFGKIQIGAPRNALDDYVNSPSVGGVDFLDVQLGVLTGSILPVALLSGNETALGLRYDGSFGGANVGVSYHDIDGSTVADVGIDYSFGQTKLMAGAEHISDSGSGASAFFLGVEHSFGQVTAGAIFGNTDIVDDSVQSLQAYAIYRPTEKLDVTASVLKVDSTGPNGTVYGLALNYNLTDIVYVEAGYLRSDDLFGSEDITTVSLGVDF